ncbi:hypothetical protein KM176_13165 [Pseudooceanicola sp. CBS1P-1]|uniref:Uncharacterized protein n=1 Tax=Pseudooceanicola albus TaxID=2692189 RepID=A0A6L7G696_9RHOB|nr:MULTISPECIES: hypothetical protein [Pseudooceanicola]MBT9384813.1 hypothetical protein [Pseudooceanicola endophyticus]MXN18193.1 hypothetical protein [Pseudooceanicola albus]
MTLSPARSGRRQPALRLRTAPVLLALGGAAALPGCMMKSAAMATSAAFSSASGAVGSAVTAGVGMAGSASAASAPGIGEGALQLTQAEAAAVALQASLSDMAEGVETCLQSLGGGGVVENAVSKGWVLTQTAAQGQSAGRQIRKNTLRGTIMPNRSCSFRTGAVAASMATSKVQSLLDEKFSGRYRKGSPYGRKGPCDGYTVDLGAERAWIFFTAENGDVCTGSGAGVTVQKL